MIETPEYGSNIVGIGKPIPDSYLDGFEVSDLTIDCSVHPEEPPDITVGGISVTGKNVLIRRVKVVHFGADQTHDAVAISAAWADSDQGFIPLNCVIEECQVASPNQDTEKVTCLRLGCNAQYPDLHYACVIRNCFVDGDSLWRDTRGLVVSGGQGTLIEGNHIRNCKEGGPFQNGETVPTADMIVRDNVYAQVRNGPSLTLPSGNTVGRIVLLNNWIELGTSDGVCGIRLNRSSANGFGCAVLRGNVIRYETTPNSVPSSDYGIHLTGCTSAIVDNNLIDVGTADHAIYHGTADGVKPFNNQTAEGEFRPGYDGTLHDQELTTEVEEVLLGLVMNGRS